MDGTLRLRGAREAETYFTDTYPWLARQILPNAAVAFARDILFDSTGNPAGAGETPADRLKKGSQPGVTAGATGIAPVSPVPELVQHFIDLESERRNVLRTA